MSVTVDMVRRLIRREYPGLISNERYQKPQYRPTRWAVLHGPSYGEKKFKGTLLIELSKMLDWSINHAKRTWTNKTLEQEAKEYFPEWLKKMDFETQAITILDEGQYGFLKDCYDELISRGWYQIYCPECKIIFKQLDKRSEDIVKVDSELSWIIDWKCMVGHELYKHTHSIRIFK